MNIQWLPNMLFLSEPTMWQRWILGPESRFITRHCLVFKRCFLSDVHCLVFKHKRTRRTFVRGAQPSWTLLTITEDKASIYVFRLFIAALHFNENENGNKEQRQIKKGNDTGRLMWQVSYQKCRKLAGVMKCVKADSTYLYRTHLYHIVKYWIRLQCKYHANWFSLLLQTM